MLNHKRVGKSYFSLGWHDAEKGVNIEDCPFVQDFAIGQWYDGYTAYMKIPRSVKKIRHQRLKEARVKNYG